MSKPKKVKIIEGRSCWDVMTLWPDACLQARFIKDGGQGVDVGEGFTKEEIIQWVQERPKMFTLVDDKPMQVMIGESATAWLVVPVHACIAEVVFDKSAHTREEVEQWVKDRPGMFTLVGHGEGEATQ